MVQSEVFDLAAQSIAVNAECVGGFRTVPVVLFQDFPDELLFELTDRILVSDAVFDELVDE